MKPHLDFEKPLVELEERIEALKQAGRGRRLRHETDLKKLEARALKLRKKIYTGLTRWQKTQLSRHPHPEHLHRIRGAPR
jgi:acetyl-CoA carboxylase carboxyl transferase subunit alpha